jgi:hypothetical protein
VELPTTWLISCSVEICGTSKPWLYLLYEQHAIIILYDPCFSLQSALHRRRNSRGWERIQRRIIWWQLATLALEDDGSSWAFRKTGLQSQGLLLLIQGIWWCTHEHCWIERCIRIPQCSLWQTWRSTQTHSSQILTSKHFWWKADKLNGVPRMW